jgi:hypothetical protein
MAQVQFTEVGDQVGIAGDDYTSRTTHGLGPIWIDYDKDGWPDLFLVNGWDSDGAHLFHNEGNGTFSRQDALLPALANNEMMGSIYADYDNDGDSDIYIFIDNHLGPVGPSAGPVNVLLKNQWVENGNKIIAGQPLFTDVTVAADVEDLLDTPHQDGPAYRAATGGWLDYDRDGHIDLYICHWDRNKHGDDTNHDRLYRNMGDGSFSDVTDSTGIIPTDDGTYARACLAMTGAHLDSDMWPDIYVGNVNAPLPWLRDYIFQNNAGTGFTDRALDSPGVGDDSHASMGVTVADIDFNGGWDVYQSDLDNTGVLPIGNPFYLHTGSDILYNDNSADVAGISDVDSWGVNFLDVDHDGYEDLFVVTMGAITNSLFINNQGDGTFSRHPGGVNDGMTGRGSAYADFDRDGDLDVAVVGINGTVALHRNDTISSGHWLQIHLVSNDTQSGNWSNRDAINTLIKVTANGKTHMRQVIGGDSGHAQNSLDLHFGLGSASIIDQIEVFWPSGATLTLNDQAVDTFMAISEVGSSAAIVSPLPNTEITNASTTFNWASSGVTQVDSWQITAGSSPGASNYFDSGSLANTQMSESVTGLPTSGTQVFVRLMYELNGFDHHIDYQYGSSNQGPQTPSVTSPVAGSTLATGDISFFWTGNGANVDDWQLLVGTSVGDNSWHDSGVLPSSTTSALVSGLPEDSSLVHVTLRWTDGASTDEVNYTYTAAGSGGGGGVPMMISPVDGSTLSGSSETFSWSAEGATVDKWRLEVGTSPDGTELFAEVVDGAVTSQAVSGLPTDGSSIYVNLKWRVGSVTTTASYTYIANGGTPGTPAITAPAPGSALATGDVNFAWASNGAVADDWQLNVGTSVGDDSLYDSGVLSSATLSAVVSGLPEDGSTLHVTLIWTDGGTPSEVNYTYTAATAGGGGGVPIMLSPADGSTLAGSSETFVWSAEGATLDKWRLEVGTSAGSRDLFVQNFDPATTSQEVTGLPTDGSTIYVNLKWRVGNVTTTASYVYIANGGTPGTPAIASPTPGSTLPLGDVSISWTSNGGVADDWQLQVGTSVGGNSLYDSGVLPNTTTSAVVSGLPEDGGTLHVTLRWTDGGNPSEVNYTYTAATAGGGGGVPIMLSPVDGSTLASASETFTWSAEGATVTQWRLEVGTTPGGRDLFVQNIGSGTTSMLVTGLPTDGSVVYVNLKWRISGATTTGSYVYTASGP